VIHDVKDNYVFQQLGTNTCQGHRVVVGCVVLVVLLEYMYWNKARGETTDKSVLNIGALLASFQFFGSIPVEATGQICTSARMIGQGLVHVGF